MVRATLLILLIFLSKPVWAREFLEPVDEIEPHIKPGYERLDAIWGKVADPAEFVGKAEKFLAPRASDCARKSPGSLAADPAPELLLSTHRPVKGSIVRVQIRAPKQPGAGSETGYLFLGDQAIELDLDKETKKEFIYEGLVGLPYNDGPGDRGLCVILGERHKCTRLEVQPGQYKKTTVFVSADKVQPKTDSESTMVKEALAHPISKKLWEGKFELPVRDPAIPNSYGKMRRYMNEKKRDELLLKKYHGGMDYLSAAGTEIRAPASGRVKLVARLNAEGNAVFIDHGRGLYTMYFHLSEFAQGLKAGQDVKQGQLLGLSGNTGRVDHSGPGKGNHLHYGAEIWGVIVNPADLQRVLSQKPAASPN